MSRSNYNFRLQKRILNSIEENFNLHKSNKSREFIAYEREYYREFITTIQPSSKATLISAILSANIVYCGDFHSFRQSQKSVLRLLRSTIRSAKGRRVCLGLECIQAKHQSHIDSFLDGKISTDELKDSVEFENHWAFPWENYLPLLEFAKCSDLKLIALNDESSREKDKLFNRDLFSGRVLANHRISYPDHLIFVLYGDLHVSRKHLPKATNEILRSNNTSNKDLVIFQNEPSIYWKLAELGLANKIEVVRLKSNTWCIVNSAPWVRLQAHLDWLEHESYSFEDENYTDSDWEEEEERLDASSTNIETESKDFLVQTSIPAKIKLISNHIFHALQLKGPTEFSFEIIPFEKIQDLIKISKLPSTPFNESRTIRTAVFLTHPILLPSRKIGYIPAYSLSAISELTAQFIRNYFCEDENWYIKPQIEFSKLTLRNARNFFVSKLINPKRRCDEINDLRALIKNPLPSKKFSARQFQQRSVRWAISYVESLDRPTDSFTVPNHADGSFAIGYSAAKIVGNIIGERLYFAWEANSFSLEDAQQFFTAPIESEHHAFEYIQKLSESWTSKNYTPKAKPDHL